MAKTDRGVSLIEAMVAVLISLFVITSLGGVVFVATAQNKNQGVEMSRVTVYAQDKIETLANLDWYDCTESTPGAGCNTTGISDSAWNQGLKPGGSLTYVNGCPASGPSIGYVDFLDAAGNQFTGADCSVVGTYAYQRQWQVTDVISTGANTPGLKRVDVIVWSRNAVNTGSAAPSAMLTTYISE
ncbi:MAG: hypothetical protein ACE145_07180 [Terriglobia bacterium]